MFKGIPWLIMKFGTNNEKSEGVVWKNLPFVGSEGNQTFPRGADFGLQQPKKMSPRVAPWECVEKQWVWTCSSLTVLNPDFSGRRTHFEMSIEMIR